MNAYGDWPDYKAAHLPPRQFPVTKGMFNRYRGLSRRLVTFRAADLSALFPAVVDDLYGIYHGVLPARDKTENELALRVRLETFERLVERPKASRRHEDVEVSQHHAAVEGDVEQASASARAAGRTSRPKPALAELQGHRVTAVLRHGNGIREIPEPLVLVQRFVFRIVHRVVPLHLHATVKIPIAAPKPAVAVCVTRVARQKPNRANGALPRRHDLDAVDKRHLVVPGDEFQVEHPVIGWPYVLEYFDIGSITSPRIGCHVQGGQQIAAIGAQLKYTRGFPATADVVFAEDGFGKIEPQFINALLQRNVVGEVALPPMIINHRVLGIGDRPRRYTAVFSTLVIVVAGPRVAVMVHYYGRVGARQNPDLFIGGLDRLGRQGCLCRCRHRNRFFTARRRPNERSH